MNWYVIFAERSRTVSPSNFKAGDYTLRVVNPESDQAVFQFRNVSSGQTQLLATTPKYTDPDREVAQLIFGRAGCDERSRTDLRIRTDDSERIDSDAGFQPRLRIDVCFRSASDRSKQ